MTLVPDNSSGDATAVGLGDSTDLLGASWHAIYVTYMQLEVLICQHLHVPVYFFYMHGDRIQTQQDSKLRIL